MREDQAILLSCTYGGVHYRIRYIDLAQPRKRPASWSHRLREVVVEKSDESLDWERLAFDLDFVSKFRLWTSADPSWPPDDFIDMGCSEDEVWFTYGESNLDGQRWMQLPGIWLAKFNRKKNKWTIRRLRTMESL